MATDRLQGGFKVYWVTWSGLLILTAVMLVLDRSPLPRLAFVLLMLAGMMTKASLIAAYFMHLRFERVALVLMVVIGLLVNAAVLYGLIVPDALRIFRMIHE